MRQVPEGVSAVPVLRRAPHWLGGYTRHTCLHGVCLVSSRSRASAVPGTPRHPENHLFSLAVLGVSGLPGTAGKAMLGNTMRQGCQM